MRLVSRLTTSESATTSNLRNPKLSDKRRTISEWTTGR